MAVQLTYPGVYIEEFTPAAPIEGVGTNTAAFIGTALSGPIDTPRLVQSWDEFVAVFGGFPAEPPGSYLAPAVFGFFLNGGTTCYVLRHGTGTKAWTALPTRQTSNPPAALTATCRVEGPSGNVVSVEVKESSRLKSRLMRANSTANGVQVHSIGIVRISSIATNDRSDVTVADTTGIAPGDRLLFTRTSGTPASAIVEQISAPGRLRLSAPLPAGNFNNVRLDDLVPGQSFIRVDVPTDLSLSQALPRGTLIQIVLGTTREVRTIDSLSGNTLRLTKPLAQRYSLADSNSLPEVTSLEFDIEVTDTGNAVTEPPFVELSMHPDHPGYWANMVTSDLITLAAPDPSQAPALDDLRPRPGIYALTGGVQDDRAAAWAEIQSDPQRFLNLVRPLDDISLVAVPGATDKAVQQSIKDHCEGMRDRFAILDSKFGAQTDEIESQREDVTSTEGGFAALYYPWIITRNPRTGRDEAIPPSGHIAGCFARTDAQRGVHKAPANVDIRGALSLERRLTDDQQGRLNLKGINVLRIFQGQGQPMIWGARTTAADTNWRYVNIRRLFIFLEESIQQGIRGSVFEPNNPSLWQKLRRTISAFLTQQWRDGALFGNRAEEAFYVRIDEALNPDSQRALGRLTIEIGVRPSYPAEFIIVRIGIWQGGSSVTEV